MYLCVLYNIMNIIDMYNPWNSGQNSYGSHGRHGPYSSPSQNKPFLWFPWLILLVLSGGEEQAELPVTKTECSTRRFFQPPHWFEPTNLLYLRSDQSNRWIILDNTSSYFINWENSRRDCKIRHMSTWQSYNIYIARGWGPLLSIVPGWEPKNTIFLQQRKHKNTETLLSMILPTYSGKIPQTSPNPHKERNSFRNCWCRVRGIFQGPVGEILDFSLIFTHFFYGKGWGSSAAVER